MQQRHYHYTQHTDQVRTHACELVVVMPDTMQHSLAEVATMLGSWEARYLEAAPADPGALSPQPLLPAHLMSVWEAGWIG